MSLQWVTPPHKSDWASRSACGHYAVAEKPRHAEFEAYWIEALWASPTLLFTSGTLADAQAVCEAHNAGRLDEIKRRTNTTS